MASALSRPRFWSEMLNFYIQSLSVDWIYCYRTGIGKKNGDVCMCVCLCVCVCVCLCVCLSMFACLPVCRSAFPCLSVYVPVCLCLPICLSVYLSLCVWVSARPVFLLFILASTHSVSKDFMIERSKVKIGSPSVLFLHYNQTTPRCYVYSWWSVDERLPTAASLG